MTGASEELRAKITTLLDGVRQQIITVDTAIDLLEQDVLPSYTQHIQAEALGDAVDVIEDSDDKTEALERVQMLRQDVARAAALAEPVEHDCRTPNHIQRMAEHHCPVCDAPWRVEVLRDEPGDMLMRWVRGRVPSAAPVEPGMAQFDRDTPDEPYAEFDNDDEATNEYKRQMNAIHAAEHQARVMVHGTFISGPPPYPEVPPAPPVEQPTARCISCDRTDGKHNSHCSTVEQPPTQEKR